MGYLQGESSRKPEGFRVSNFKINLNTREAICPENQKTRNFTEYNDGKICIRFDKETCMRCPHFELCVGIQKSKKRKLVITPNHHQIQARRKEQKTIRFKEEMRVRAQVEGTISEAVRFHGLRYKKYKGCVGDKLQFYFTGAVINIKRILRVLSCEMVASIG